MKLIQNIFIINYSANPSFRLIKFQIYTPSQILNQSHVVMMFKSGAGVEVIENKHYMACRVFLPWEFVVSNFLNML